MSLEAGGAPVVLQRDLGTPSAVQGFEVFGSPLSGAQLTAPIVGTVLMQAGTRSAQYILVAIVGSTFWVKVAGTWRQAMPWIKVSGVWKVSTPYIKVGGVWK